MNMSSVSVISDMAQDRGIEIVQYEQSKPVMEMIISEEVKHMREALTYYNISLVHPKFMDDLP